LIAFVEILKQIEADLRKEIAFFKILRNTSNRPIESKA